MVHVVALLGCLAEKESVRDWNCGGFAREEAFHLFADVGCAFKRVGKESATDVWSQPVVSGFACVVLSRSGFYVQKADCVKLHFGVRVTRVKPSVFLLAIPAFNQAVDCFLDEPFRVGFGFGEAFVMRPIECADVCAASG